MIVKVCGITNLDDALAAVDAGANALGFVFYPGSPRAIKPGAAGGIIAKLPAGITKAGVFVNEPAASIDRAKTESGIDVAQLHGYCEAPAGMRTWRAVRVDPGFCAWQVVPAQEEAILLDTASDTAHGGTGRTFDWALAQGIKHRVIIAGGLDAGNVAQAIEAAQPWGVDASSRLERAPGLKDHVRVRAYVQAALAAATALK